MGRISPFPSLNDSFVYLGFPSIYGSARAAEPDGLVAISADTQYADACWQLIKIMLSNEVQEVEINQQLWDNKESYIVYQPEFMVVLNRR